MSGDATTMTADDSPRGSTLRSALFGAHGFERATVWAAVGFALTYVAFEAESTLGGDAAAWLAGGAVAVAAIGSIGLARDGTGAIPCTVLIYGPAAAVGLRAIEPRYVEVLPAAATVEPLGVAAAVALAVGPASFIVGRVLSPSE